MGYHTIPGTDLQYGLIAYDGSGVERPEAKGLFSKELIGVIEKGAVSDLFFFSHGWKGDIPAAIDQYDRWIGALVRSADFASAKQRLSPFRPLFIGLHWPSEPWGEEEARADGSFSPTESSPLSGILAQYLARLGDTPEIRAPLNTILLEAQRNLAPASLPATVRQAYLDLNAALGLRSEGVAAPPDADREQFNPDDAFDAGNQDDIAFGGLNLGGILGPLRQLSYWTMKKRARTIGEGGMHDFLLYAQTASRESDTRIHLMGHSFGTIVISAMLGGKGAHGKLQRPVNSVALLQGAVSLWCYAPTIPFHNAGSGYFSPIISDGKIRGPLITTQSRFDKAVGNFYPLASQIYGTPSFVNQLPEYGAIGAYGLQGLDPSIQSDIRMLPAGGEYKFSTAKVYNLESSEFICHGDGPSGAHSDIAGPEVANAIWDAAFASVHAPEEVLK
jgi:hypothetical protein